MEFVIRKKIDKLGRVVIPVDIRRLLDLNGGDFAEIKLVGNAIYIKKCAQNKQMCAK